MLNPKKIRTSTLQEFKAAGQKFACLTSYDYLTAGIFDEAGIEVLLVGDSAADNHLGYDSTLPITIDEVIPFGRAVAKAANRALVVVDMPFGSYEISNELALSNAIRLLKTTSSAAVKLEGGVRSADRIKHLTEAGIPVMGHIGFTPQSVHQLGGFKVQGRGEGAEKLFADAKAVEAAGAFAVVLELVPAELAAEVSKELSIPTIGIGAGAGCDAQILVWTDFAGLTAKARKFVKRYAELRSTLMTAASDYHAEVLKGEFPTSDHEFN
ncbi:MAG: 3-methyl-2-oxobutanoate hydroxymethyltransferase [Micrococcales bacterium]